MSTPFDRSLEARELMVAADEYASRQGDVGSPGYRAAWLEFRQRPFVTEGVQDRLSAPAAAVNVDAVGVLNAAIERAMLVDGASMATAQIFDPGVGALRLVAHHGFAPAFVDFFQVVDDRTTSCGSALATGTPVWVADTTRSPIFAGTRGLEILLEAGSRAVASLPLISPDGRVIGMISTHHQRPTSWTRDRQLELRRVAQSAGRLLDYVSSTAGSDSRGLLRIT
jgi:hypothetical protein